MAQSDPIDFALRFNDVVAGNPDPAHHARSPVILMGNFDSTEQATLKRDGSG